MKSTVVILSTLFGLCGLYAAYIRFIPAPAPAAVDRQPLPTTLPTPSSDPQNPMPGGVGTWGNQYDKDQNLYARFRAVDYQRLPDGTYHLTNPEADFYQPSQQVIHLRAASGDIRVDQNAQHLEMSGATPSLPRQGTLKDVTIDIFPNRTVFESHPDQPDVTISMPNMRFNTDTFQILTAEYTDPQTGRVIPADQVPVTVRGKVEFDGTGLVLYWDDVTHEIRSLTVAHGSRMLIKDISSANKPAKPDAPGAGGAPAALGDAIASGGSDSNIAPGSPTSGKPNPSSQPPKQETVFQAVFSNDVKVNQAGVDRIWADAMYVDFLMGSESKPQAIARQDLPAALQTPDGDSSAPALPPRTPSPPAGAKSPKISSSSTADFNAQGPVLILWNGPLRVTPAPDPAPRLSTGQRIVKFIGSPVRVHGDDVDAQGDLVQYNSAGEVAHIRGTPERPLVIIRRRPDGTTAATVTGQALRFSRPDHQALFSGAGDAQFPDPANPQMLLKAAWEKSCNVQLEPGAGGEDKDTIHTIDLDGNSSIVQGTDLSDPRLNLQSNHITIDFQPRPVAAAKKSADESPDVKDVVATGSAHCVIRDSKSPDRTIDADQLSVATAHDPTGKLFPQFIVGKGNVHASEGEQNLHSDRMDVTLAPAQHSSRKNANPDQTDVELLRLLASGHVVAHGKNGATVVGDLLQVEQHDDKQLITVLGQPPALINDGAGSLSGAEVDVRPKDDWAMVPCAGTIDAAQASRDGSVEPIHITWDQNAELVGAENRADIRGNVVATTTDTHEGNDTARADHVILTLGPKPATQPSSTRPSSDDPSLAGTQLHFLQGKEVRKVTLLDHAEVNSTYLNPDGSLLRRANVFGDEIDFFTAEKRFEVPVPGRMLLEDHSPNTAKTGQETSNGKTAFMWQKSFVFDELARRATFDSPVTIVHVPDGKDAQPVRLIADHVVADFDPAGPAPAAGSDAMASEKLKDVTAQGHVKIFSRETEIDANEADYDPTGELLIAKGQEGAPVVVTDGQDRGDATFGEVWYNTRTGQVVKMIDFSGHSH